MRGYLSSPADELSRAPGVPFVLLITSTTSPDSREAASAWSLSTIMTPVNLALCLYKKEPLCLRMPNLSAFFWEVRGERQQAELSECVIPIVSRKMAARIRNVLLFAVGWPGTLQPTGLDPLWLCPAGAPPLLPRFYRPGHPRLPGHTAGMLVPALWSREHGFEIALISPWTSRSVPKLGVLGIRDMTCRIREQPIVLYT